MRNVRNNAGFTLIELMIVVVIIGILAAIAIPKFSSFSDSAREKEAQTSLKALHTLQEMYYTTYGAYADATTRLVEFGYDPATTYKYYDLQAFTIGTNATTGTATLCIGMKQNGTTKNITDFSINQSGKMFEGSIKC